MALPLCNVTLRRLEFSGDEQICGIFAPLPLVLKVTSVVARFGTQSNVTATNIFEISMFLTDEFRPEISARSR